MLSFVGVGSIDVGWKGCGVDRIDVVESADIALPQRCSTAGRLVIQRADDRDSDLSVRLSAL